MTPQVPVVVVGAGLAGLSCAFELADRGVPVVVLEGRDVVGGRTSSWVADGMPVESGLHKFLGIYRALPALLERAGIDLGAMLTWTDELRFALPGGADALFTVAPYRHPLDTARTALSNTDFLPTVEKAKLAAMGAAGMARAATNPDELDALSIADYARQWGVADDVIQRVLSTSTQAALFLPAEQFSAYAAFAPVVEGLKHGMTMRIGAFNGGMSEVMIEPLVAAIAERGGAVRRSAPVSAFYLDAGRVAGVAVGGEIVAAAHVVLATSLKPAQDLLRRQFHDDDWLQRMFTLPSLSAATMQFELDGPALDSDRTNFSPTNLCCFAEQSRTTFRHVPGRLSTILYPPETFLKLSPEEALERAYDAADELGMPLRGHVSRYRVVNHPHDFYAMRPGSEILRPEQQTPIPGLSLAGDYTRQAFSASMEGAVVAGQRAAEAAMEALAID